MKRYEHVILFGVDGGGRFFEEGDTPRFDAIFAGGAVKYNALTSFPSISAECWSSMLTGVSPYLHGRTNSILGSEIYPEDAAFPTFFKRLRREMPEAVIGAYCDWTPLVHGLVEPSAKADCLSLRDNELIEPVCNYIKEKKPDLLFIHTDSVDHAGHSCGYGTKPYMEQIHVMDGYIGKVFDAVTEAGIADDTLFIVVCDHGGTCDPREEGGFHGGHGGWTRNEREITVAVRGKGVEHGTIGEMNIRDMTAILLYAFGMEIPAFDLSGFTAQLPKHLFAGVDTEYRDISGETAAAPRISAQQHATALL